MLVAFGDHTFNCYSSKHHPVSTTVDNVIFENQFLSGIVGLLKVLQILKNISNFTWSRLRMLRSLGILYCR